jgi:hypothetical protein
MPEPKTDLLVPKRSVKERILPFFAPYYLVLGGLLGAATVGFLTVIVLLILVATNFNVLGLIE